MSVPQVGCCTRFFNCIFSCCITAPKEQDEKVQSIDPPKKITQYQVTVQASQAPKAEAQPKRKIDKERRKKLQSTEFISIRQVLHERQDSTAPQTSRVHFKMGETDV